jgi:hypothetical protein
MPLYDQAERPIMCTGQNDPVLSAFTILLIFVLLALAAHVTALIAHAYWDHFIMVLYFDSKF